MRVLQNTNAPPSGVPIEYHIGTAYDCVKLVANNIEDVKELADAIENGDFDDLLKSTDIDLLAKLNAIITDANVGDRSEFATADQGALADSAIQGPFASAGEAIGGTDNTHAMTALRVAQAIEVFADTKQNKYDATVPPGVTDDSAAGYTVGSVWIDIVASPQESYRCADATTGAAVWILTTLTTDEMAAVALTGNSDDLTEGVTKLLMTVAERSKLAGIETGATADQTGAEIKSLYEGELDTNAFDDAAQTKLAGVETGATADQTDSEIVVGYGNVVPVVTQSAAELGAQTSVTRWTAQRVAQAIAALGGGGGGGGLTVLYKDANYTLEANDEVFSQDGLTHTLPATPTDGDVCAVWDVSDNAANNSITIDGNGETITSNGDGTTETEKIINMNGGGFKFTYVVDTWVYIYVIQTIQPSTTITRRKEKVFWMEDMTVPNAQAPGPEYVIGGSNAQVQYTARPFDAASVEVMLFDWLVPEDYDAAIGLSFIPIWSPITTNVGDVLFELRVIDMADGDAIDVNQPGAGLQSLDTAQGTANEIHYGPQADFVVVDAVPRNIASIRYQRSASTGSDTHAADAYIIGVKLVWQENETLTAAANFNPNAFRKIIPDATYTISADDIGYELIFTNAGSIAVDWPDGLIDTFHCIVSQAGAGTPTVTPSGTDTINGAGLGVFPAAQWAGLYIGKFSATEAMAKGT